MQIEATSDGLKSSSMTSSGDNSSLISLKQIEAKVADVESQIKAKGKLVEAEKKEIGRLEVGAHTHVHTKSTVKKNVFSRYVDLKQPLQSLTAVRCFIA